MSKALEEAAKHLEEIEQQIEQVKNELQALTLLKQPNRQEIIDLLEKATDEFLRGCTLCEAKDNIINQALTLLKQPKCKTCGDTGQVEYELDDIQGDAMVPCPDCQQPKKPLPKTQIEDGFFVCQQCGHKHEIKQPTAAAFTKELREQHEIIKYDLRFRPAAIEENIPKKEYYKITQYTKRIEEVLDRLDTAEAININLLKTCKDILPALKKIKETQKIDPFYLDVLIAVLEKQTGCRPPVEGETDNPDPPPNHEFSAKAKKEGGNER